MRKTIEKNAKKLLLLFAMLVFFVGSYAQGITVKGTVRDSKNEPVIGASVVVQNQPGKGTSTNVDGNFELSNVNSNATLIISYVGMQSQSIALNGRSYIDVVLEDDTKSLSEVVVVGYGTTKKANLTGAVSQVKMKDVLGDRPINNAISALQGTIPGLMVSGSSTPGQDNKVINIRGTLSINGGSPLVLIDNVPGDLNYLNPEDIESVSVLKDAASSAIYGARAANGVVLVTTKRPANNTQFKVNYNNNFGFETSINRPLQTSLEQYFKAYQDAGFNNLYWANSQDVTKWAQYLKDYKADPSKFNIIGDGIYMDGNTPYYLNEKDLFDNVLTQGFFQNHNISVSGGTKNVRYRMAGGFTTENGPLITAKDQFKRINVSSFISADMTPWFTQELDIRYAKKNKTMPQGVGNDIYTMRLINYYPEGSMPASLLGTVNDIPLFTPKNLILFGNTSNVTSINPRIFSKSIFKPLPGLEAVLEYTFDKDDNNYAYYADKWTHTTVQLAVTSAPANDTFTKRRYFEDYNAINAYATYQKSFGEHNFKVMAGYGQETSHYEYVQNQAKDLIKTPTPSLGVSTGEVTNDDWIRDYSIRSLFYRLNYNYLDKYLIEFNGRYDGSSKFPKVRRFGFFPSVSVGWQVAKEKFMDFSKGWLNEFKLRASWGSIGNQNILPYQYSPSMGIDNANTVWVVDGKKVTTIGVPSLVSSTFTWETVESIDIGADLSLLNNRLTTTFDWYQRDTKGMLAKDGTKQLPAVVGTDAPLDNGADMRTRGWEFGINWRDNIGKLGYRVGFNVYDHHSFITKYANESGLLSDYYVGRKFGEIWGYVANGFYTLDDFENTTTWKLKEGVTSIRNTNVRPGDLKFANLMDDENSTNRIDDGNNTLSNPGDRKIIGNTTSRYQFGANFGISYAGFDLSAVLQGVGKKDVWIGGQALFPFAGSGAADAVFQPLYYNQTDYWKPKSLDPTNADYMQPENPNAKYFRIYNQMENAGSNTRISSKFLQNGAYLRVKNITLSYVFPRTLLKKISVDQFKLFVGVENVATFTSLPKGIDPENLGWMYPFYRTVSFGTNITF